MYVCMYVNSNIANKRRPDLECDELELMWVEIKTTAKPSLIGVSYRPPGMNRPEAVTYIQQLQQNLVNVANAGSQRIILMGDFNDRCTEWEGSHVDSELKQELLDTTAAIGLNQLINELTYHTATSANILDLIFTDSPRHIINMGTLPPIGTSKHEVVFCEYARRIYKEKPYKKEIWKYQDADIEGLNTVIAEFPWDDIMPDDINQAAEIWTLPS